MWVEDVSANDRAEDVYFGKAKDVVGDLRSRSCILRRGCWSSADVMTGIPPLTEANRDRATHQEMINSMKR